MFTAILVGSQQEVHQCPKCGRRYKQKQNLTTHIRLDCGKEGQFPCLLCPYKAKRNNILKFHLITKHKIIQ